MSSLASQLARPEILALAPADVSASADALFGPDAVKLDANENPYAPLVQGGIADGANRYPEPQPARLRQTMASLYGVQPQHLLVTRGGDDAIDVLIRTFCRPQIDAIAICPPTFTAYAAFAALQGARVIEAPLTPQFDFSGEVLIDAVRQDGAVKLAFICSPNNPTGNRVDPAAILGAADALPETILVVDEAYLEFSGTPSLAGEATARHNLVVLKTLSKAYGLAGARVGALIGNPELIGLAARALPPYPLPTLSIEAALAILAPSRRPVHEERIASIVDERERLVPLLSASPDVRSVRSGGGNFLFLEVDHPDVLASRLQRLGVRVRFRPNAAPGGIRLSIGSKAENEVALAAFGIGSGKAEDRSAELVRDTKETRIAVRIDLDRDGPRRISTGIPFFDHMLDQVAAHGGFALTLSCDGDLDIDAHHSVEDCAIAFGSCLAKALADRRGIGRFGFALPMDETQAQVLIDLSGRPYCRFEGSFESSHIGAYPTEMTAHVFRSIADSLGAAVHVKVSGENDHHKTEACFKAFGRALRPALACSSGGEVPSTKGML